MVGDDVANARTLAATGAVRSARLVEALGELTHDELIAPSALEDWSRLTIACHLRYGASTLLRMTDDVLAGRTTSYYPEGRKRQRPHTLEPRSGEQPESVVSSLGEVASALDALWSQLRDEDWAKDVVEPPDDPDLGTVPLARLAMARLLEVDVHGTDLAIDFLDWSSELVDVAVPTRLQWLATRRTNHRDFDQSLRGSWLLIADDGLEWLVVVDEHTVESRPADASVEQASAVIEGSRRDLLALLLDRPTQRPLRIAGDVDFGASFSRAFPGP